MFLRKALRSLLFCQKRVLFLSVIVMLLITMIYYGSNLSLLYGSSKDSGEVGKGLNSPMLNRVLPPPPPPANKFSSVSMRF